MAKPKLAGIRVSGFESLLRHCAEQQALASCEPWDAGAAARGRVSGRFWNV